MPSRSLTISTGTSVEDFAGAYHQYFTKLYAPERLAIDTPEFEFESIDEGEDATALFRTSVHMTSASPHDLSETALYRLACFFMISRLSESSVKEACEALADIYHWQLAPRQGAMRAEWQSVAGSPTVAEIKRPPFTLND